MLMFKNDSSFSNCSSTSKLNLAGLQYLKDSLKVIYRLSGNLSEHLKLELASVTATTCFMI